RSALTESSFFAQSFFRLCCREFWQEPYWDLPKRWANSERQLPSYPIFQARRKPFHWRFIPCCKPLLATLSRYAGYLSLSAYRLLRWCFQNGFSASFQGLRDELSCSCDYRFKRRFCA